MAGDGHAAGPTPTTAASTQLAAALDCFVSKGFHGTAVPEVARKAGMATGSMYHYFPSKQALVNALFRKWKEAIATRVFPAFPAAAPVREQFR
ncbi:MAG: helix-turn-helix domain-containing protein [bacterium]